MAADDEYLQTRLELLETFMTNKHPGEDGNIMRQAVDCIGYLKKIKQLKADILSKTGVNIQSTINTYLAM